MTVPTFRECAAQLRDLGYLPIPIAPHSKRPLQERWQAYEFQRGDEQHIDLAAGVGILCGLVRPVDIDVSNARLANIIREAAIATWGSMPFKVGMPPKSTVFVRTASAAHKLQSLRFRFPDDAPGSKPHGIEILGTGQQTVCYGIHPDTGREYEWPDLDLLEVPLAQLPVATEDELHNFVAWCNNFLLEQGGTPVGRIASRDAGLRSSNDELAAFDPSECAAAIAALRNDDLTWDDWVYVGLAIKGALGEQGRALWHEFSRQSAKYDPARTDRQFSSFKPERIGAGTLYRLAFDSGWARPERTGIDISALLGEPKAPDRLKPLRVDEILRQTPQSWLVRGVVPKRGLVLVYGQSGSGKSFFTLDLAAAVARGIRWYDRRVKQGGVILVAGEGHVRSRLAAYLAQHSLDQNHLERLRVVNTNLDLRNPRADLAPLVASLREAADEMGGVVLVVLDTLNSMMGAGDENESADMGAMISAARAITHALDCATLYIHHSGKDESRGARGHSSLRAAVDTEIQVKGQSFERLATITKQRDGETGINFPFRLASVDLGPSPDPDADPDERETSCTVVPLSGVDVSALFGSKTLSAYAQSLLRLVQPTPIRKATLRTDFYQKLDNMSPEAKKKAFQRAFSELLKCGKIDENAGEAWLAESTEDGT